MEEIELINLTLDEIRRSAEIVSYFIEDAEILKLKNKDNKDGVIEKLKKNNEKALFKLRKELSECLDNIAEFQKTEEYYE